MFVAIPFPTVTCHIPYVEKAESQDYLSSNVGIKVRKYLNKIKIKKSPAIQILIQPHPHPLLIKQLPPSSSTPPSLT